MTSDIRDETTGAVRLVSHFDVLTRPHSLTPYPSQITADNNPTAHQLTDFLPYTDGLYAVGSATGTTVPLVFYRSDYTSTAWLSKANNSGTTAGYVPGVFVYYHSKFYGSNSNGNIWKNDPAGGAWVDGDTTLAGPCTANGLVHSKDDILYMATNNIIASNNNGSWTTAALTLPNNFTITCLAEYGNYLAIACAPIVGKKSVVFLWDRDSTVNTLAESIDFGTGNLQIITQIEGDLIGISRRTDAGAPGTVKLVFRSYSGGVADVFREITASSAASFQLLSGQKQNQRLYFLAGLYIDSVYHPGIWAVGKNAAGRWIIWHDRLPANNTALTGNAPLQGFYIEGDYALTSYLASGAFVLTMTSSGSGAYAGSSVIETTINPEMPLIERTNNKTLVVLAPTYDPIPSGGQVVIKWRVDGSAWATARTETAMGTVVSEISQTEASFTNGREYQFRIESTGGVVVTGIKYKYEVLDSLI
jgi:hypothetical protein